MSAVHGGMLSSRKLEVTMVRYALSLSLSAMLLPCFGGLAHAQEDPAQNLRRMLAELEVVEALLAGQMNESTQREALSKVQQLCGDLRAMQVDAVGQPDPGMAGKIVPQEGPNMGGAAQAPYDGVDQAGTMMTPAGPNGAEPYGEPYQDGQQIRSDKPPEKVQGPAGAMVGDDFPALMEALEGESFEDGKLGVLRDACAHNRFSAAQVAKLVGLFSFSDGKVEAAVMLYPRTVDTKNFFQVYEAFEFDRDKEEVRHRLGL